MDPEEEKAKKEAEAKAEREAAEAKAKALTDSKEYKELKDSVQSLGEQVKAMADKLEDKTKNDESKKPIQKAATAMKAAVEAVIEDSSMKLEDKNKQLQEMAVQIQDAFSQLTGVPTDPKAAAKLDSMKAASSASKALTDSLSAMLASESKESKAKALNDKFESIFDKVGGEGFSDDDKKKLHDKLAPRVGNCKDEEEVKQLIEDSLEMMNMGRAKQELLSMGFTKPAAGGADTGLPATAVVDARGDTSHLHFVNLLQDKCRQTGEFHPLIDHSKLTILGDSTKPIHPQLKKVMDKWDQLHGQDLRKEQEHAMRAGNGKLTDATVHADFETPYTIARMVLFEAYADQIIMGVTSFGTMDNDRDQVPITKWRRTSTNRKTFLPNLKERTEIKVAELNSIPEGKLTTDWYPIDASARKLRALLSDEFITRAKRRPDITGVAKAAQNLVDDVRRSLEQDIFYEMIKCALTTDAVAFTSTQDGDGVTTIFQVTSASSQVGAIAIDAADAEAIVPESLTVEEGGLVVPEWGTTSVGGGTGGNYFYQVDHANGLIGFVDAAGAPLAPINAVGQVEVTAGLKAGGLSSGRFDLTAPGGVDHEAWMNRFLFQIQNLASSMPSNTGYMPDMLVQQRNLATLTQQARAYEREAARRAFRGDAGPVIDGNFGTTADLRHFASSVFPANFTVVGLSEATLYRVYEPLILRGPIESRDTNGQLTGGKEWYSYQEDSIGCPLPEKLALITTYTS
jgi:hypothetical protein